MTYSTSNIITEHLVGIFSHLADEQINNNFRKSVGVYTWREEVWYIGKINGGKIIFDQVHKQWLYIIYVIHSFRS